MSDRKLHDLSALREWPALIGELGTLGVGDVKKQILFVGSNGYNYYITLRVPYSSRGTLRAPLNPNSFARLTAYALSNGFALQVNSNENVLSERTFAFAF